MKVNYQTMLLKQFNFTNKFINKNKFIIYNVSYTRTQT